MAAAPQWEAQIAGRLLAGTGGVLLNVLMTKLVADAFAGAETATAMGIFVNSWPVGIAAALLVLPRVAGPADPTGAWSVLALVVLGLALFALGTRPRAGAAPPPPAGRLPARAHTAVLLAGAAWGLYNGALGMIFAFGPALLAERGWTLAAAGGTTSLVLWLVAATLPFGGLIADRTGRPGTVIAAGLTGFGLALAAVPLAPGLATPLFVMAGLCAGLPAGPIMALPQGVLTPATRALGMGLFFTLFYAGVVGAPFVAGALAAASGTAAAAFWLGAALTAAAGAAVLAFRAIART
jgi:MFS family permease